jgi:hypothetical protein
MHATNPPPAASSATFSGIVGLVERAQCGNCGRIIGIPQQRNPAGKTSCPHCNSELSIGTPIASCDRSVPPPATIVAPPIQTQMRERIISDIQKRPNGNRFPLVFAISGGLGLLAVAGVVVAAVVATVFLQRPTAKQDDRDIVTEIQLSDAERNQTELDGTKATNRQLQNEIFHLELQSRTLENELTQLRKAVL